MKTQLFFLHIFCSRIFPAFLVCLFFLNINAQQSSVTIKINGYKNEPVANATIKISSWPDSTYIQNKIADSSGIAIVSLTKNTKYSITISAIDHLPFEKGINYTGNQSYFSFHLEPSNKNLDTVTIASKKPLMRQENDKLIVDPENMVASSSSGFEVIEKIPGVFMDQDGNIYLNSMTPATVQVNGREMKTSAADVASMLKSLPPNAIAKIEILKTPSAKYDASGGGGIVNVVLQKGIKLGLTGSINTGIQQGVYGNKFIGFNLNKINGKKSSYININYSTRNSYEKINTTRLFAVDTFLKQEASSRYPGNVFHSNYGLAWSLGNKWELEFDGSASKNESRNNSDNNSFIKKISTDKLLTNNLNYSYNKNSSLNLNNGIKSKYKIDSVGSEWTTDLFYTISTNNSNQDFTIQYLLPQVPLITGEGDVESNRNVFSVRSDLKIKLTNKLTVETGLKTSFLRFENKTNYFRESNSVRAKDIGRTNSFLFKEKINAAYLQTSKTFGKDVILKAGTRLENTNMDGRQTIPADTVFKVNRTDLFPYLFLSKGIMKIASYQLRAYLVYRRTIQRPVYEQLNPFARFVDQYLSEVGNPSLQPQFTNNYEVNVSFEERPVLAVGFKDTKDIFTNVIYQADSSQSQAYRTYDNLGNNKEWYFRGLGALPPGGKYFFVLGAQYNHNFYSGYYDNKPLSYKRGSWMMFTYHTLKLGKRSQVSMNGFVRFKGLLQFTEVNTFGAMNLNINRRFLKDKLTVTLSGNDILLSNKYDFSLQQGSVNVFGLRQNDTRRVGLNIRYNFGIRKKEDKSNLFDIESPEKQ